MPLRGLAVGESSRDFARSLLVVGVMAVFLFGHDTGKRRRPLRVYY
jgi:hypothetical protein